MLDADPLTIKKFTTDIEDATPLGRLFDMDVIRPDGLKVDREELDPRRPPLSHLRRAC